MRFRNWICFFLVFRIVTGYSQDIIIQPPFIDVYSCSSISDLYAVSINSFRSDDVAVKMNLEVFFTSESSERSLLAQGDFRAAPIYNLRPGLTTINAGNIDEIFPVRSIEFLDSDIEGLIRRTNCLPPGSYEVCLSLFETDDVGTMGDRILSQTCYTRTKENLNSIFLISPLENTIVGNTLPIFSWTPIVPFPDNSQYTIQIVELFEGQSAFEAFRSNPLFFSQDGLTNNIFQYPIESRPFNPCIRYAWRVLYEQSSGFSNPQFRGSPDLNNSSELWEFSSLCPNTQFRTIPTYEAPVLVFPSDEEVLASVTDVFFHWTEINADYVNYELRVVERPITNTPLYYFNNAVPLLSVELENQNYYEWFKSELFLELDKEYVWGVIPYDNEGNQLVEGLYIEKHTFTFGSGGEIDELPVDSVLPELTKYEMMRNFPLLGADRSAVLVEIALEDNLNDFGCLLYTSPSPRD